MVLIHSVQSLQRLIQSPKIPAENKLRLTAIYALKYAKHPSNSIPILLDLLAVAGNLSRHRINLIPKLLRYHDSLQTQAVAGGIPDLFQPGALFSGARDRIRGLKGVENVYTQHSPRLEGTLTDLIKGKLRDSLYPFLEGGIGGNNSANGIGGGGGGGGAATTGGTSSSATRDKPQDVIVFVVGGATYEEAKMVAQVNASSPGVRVVLGGTTVHNSGSFLEEVEDVVDSWPVPGAETASGRLKRDLGRV